MISLTTVLLCLLPFTIYGLFMALMFVVFVVRAKMALAAQAQRALMLKALRPRSEDAEDDSLTEGEKADLRAARATLGP